MQFYSNSKPNLVGQKIKKSVYKIMKKKSDNITISDKISNMMSSFYNNYIKENKPITFFLLFTIIFLMYRYYNKKRDDEIKKIMNNENFRYDGVEDKIMNGILKDQTSHLKYDTQPTVDRLQSVNTQAEKVYYTPDPIRIDLPSTEKQGPKNEDRVNTVYARNIYADPRPFQNLNIPDYNYNNVYLNPQRSYYTGTFNPYENAQDTNIVNPFGFSTKFNTTTGNFIGGMTQANKQNVIDYQSILDNMNANLINSLKLGPKYLDINSPELEMEPPYAT